MNLIAEVISIQTVNRGKDHENDIQVGFRLLGEPEYNEAIRGSQLVLALPRILGLGYQIGQNYRMNVHVPFETQTQPQIVGGGS